MIRYSPSDVSTVDPHIGLLTTREIEDTEQFIASFKTAPKKLIPLINCVVIEGVFENTHQLIYVLCRPLMHKHP